MLTPDGPKVLEFNVRFGDPETQVLMARWQGDVAAVLAAAAAGRLDEAAPPVFSTDAAVCVVLAAPGYPESPKTGDLIHGFDRASSFEGVAVHAAGVKAGLPAGRLVTAGGRVLAVSATAPRLAAARAQAYRAVAALSWPGITFRTDIAAVAASQDAGTGWPAPPPETAEVSV
jgi:phosphoribosylamine---glycine ligase